jgi:hypothetical protein
VTFPAVGFQLPLVKILMAGAAFVGNGPVTYGFTKTTRKLFLLHCMAFFARNSFVFSLQRIVGIFLVIEFEESLFEVFGGMANIALFIELLKVDIFMAACAVGHKGFVNDGFIFFYGIMALFASNRPVFSRQGIPAAVMVIDALAESPDYMTRAAIPVELTVVRVFSVTIIASREGHFL